MSLEDKHKKAHEEVLTWASSPSLKNGAPNRSLLGIFCAPVSYHSQDHVPLKEYDTSDLIEKTRRDQEAKMMMEFPTLSAKLLSDEKLIKNRCRYAEAIIDTEPSASATVKIEWEKARPTMRKLANLNRAYVEQGLRLSRANTASHARTILENFSKTEY